MRKAILFLIAILFSRGLAQFGGGVGDGAAGAGITEPYGLNGAIPTTVFLGGNGDGFGYATYGSVLGLNGAISSAFFGGGNGDGHALAAITTPYGLNGPISSTFFGGGNGDGHALAATSTIHGLNGAISSAFFGGGNGDGYGAAGTGADIPLPVMFSSMSAVGEDGRVTITWITEAEINNAGFILLRQSPEDSLYEVISSYLTNPDLRGAGTSNERHIYRYVDYNVLNGYTYRYKIVEVDFDGVQIEHGPVTAIPMPQGVPISRMETAVPEKLTLLPNFPNPFNPETYIPFGIPGTRSETPEVTLTIYDLLGRKVRHLFTGRLAPGFYRVLWDGRSNSGDLLPTGVYIYQIMWGEIRQSRRLMLIK